MFVWMVQVAPPEWRTAIKLIDGGEKCIAKAEKLWRDAGKACKPSLSQRLSLRLAHAKELASAFLLLLLPIQVMLQLLFCLVDSNARERFILGERCGFLVYPSNQMLITWPGLGFLLRLWFSPGVSTSRLGLATSMSIVILVSSSKCLICRKKRPLQGRCSPIKRVRTCRDQSYPYFMALDEPNLVVALSWLFRMWENASRSSLPSLCKWFMRVLSIHSDMLNSRDIYQGPLAQLHQYLHHHDIAERNVVIAADGTLMLIDLGSAVPRGACQGKPCPDEFLLSDYGAFE
jgi:hypothetical protein